MLPDFSRVDVDLPTILNKASALLKKSPGLTAPVNVLHVGFFGKNMRVKGFN